MSRSKFEALQREQRARFVRLTERRAVARVREVYDTTQASVLRDLLKGQVRSARELGRRLDAAQLKVLRAVGGEVLAAQQEAHLESVHGMSRVSEQLFRSSALEDPVRVSKIISSRRKELVSAATDRLSETARTVSENLHARVLQSSLGGMRDALEEGVDDEWWRYERIARTEAAAAYNAAQMDTHELLAREFPGLMSRWTEHVDDATLRPLDRRVGTDSIAMHGQVTTPGGLFHAPDDPRMKGISGAWHFPPNRPNDRAILMPWTRSMGVPAWMWRAGEKVAVT